MSTTPPTLCDNAPADPARAELERQAAILGRLAEIGLKVAEVLDRQADAILAQEPAPEAHAPEVEALKRSYARVSRAIQISLMLQQKIRREIEALASGAAARRKAEEAERRSTVRHIVKRVAENAGRSPVEVIRLGCQADDRLLRTDLYGDILARPVSEVLAMVCKDLDLPPDWEGLASEAWAVEEIGSGEVGWPLAGLSQSPSPQWGRVGMGWGRPAPEPGAEGGVGIALSGPS